MSPPLPRSAVKREKEREKGGEQWQHGCEHGCEHSRARSHLLLLAAGYEFTIDLRPPHPARCMTKISALDLRISSGGTTRLTNPLISSSI